jgi:hypothetical protein
VIVAQEREAQTPPERSREAGAKMIELDQGQRVIAKNYDR